MDGPDRARQNTDEPTEALFPGPRRRRGCFSLPCFCGPPSRSTWWQKLRATAEIARGDPATVWARGTVALKRIRDWSEIVAGPRWKTFVRRLNRVRGGGRHANFNYDPMSYAMNFDDGPGPGRADEEGEDGYYYGPRNFSSRYARGSMDLGKDGPTFVEA